MCFVDLIHLEMYATISRSIDIILSLVSVLTSLVACFTVYNYFRRLPKGRVLLPWLLMLAGMWFIAFSEVADAFLLMRDSVLDLVQNVLTIIAEVIFAYAFIRLFAIDLVRFRSRVDHLEEAANSDKLSGLGNRRLFDQKLAEEFVAAREGDYPIALAILDLDHFKSINDRFGHLAGDEAIRRVAQLLGSFVRSRDTAARIGGDELGLILPGTSLHEAEVVVERIREKLEDTPFAWEGASYPLTCSVGLTASTPQGYPVDEVDFFRQADVALYRAKAAGRNQVFVETIPAARSAARSGDPAPR